MQSGKRDRWLTWAVCGLLLLAVGLVFGQTLGHQFINLDDDMGVYDNPHVTGGLNWHAVGWALTSRHVGNWDPLTWISHMLDWQLYGPWAGGHHLTNVLLHAATVLLLFLVLRQMTGRLWPSALAAAIFAVHPMRVESVAWVTERKDVLSGLFFMLTLGAYVGYVRSRARETHHEPLGAFHAPYGSLLRYLAVMVLFTLGLMAKPMLVTLPCVLLLLDYWPLGRTKKADNRGLGTDDRGLGTSVPSDGRRKEGSEIGVQEPGEFPPLSFLRLLLEKVPLLALVAGSCTVTVWAEFVSLYKHPSLRWQIDNLLVTYVVYLRQFFYPVDLAPLAPRRELDLPLWQVGGAALILLALTAGAFALRRNRPYLLVGWLWYLGMLFPVIGLVPFGTQGAADRFTYLPQIGLCIALVWGAADLCRCGPRRRWVCGVGAAAVLAVLAGCAWRQTAYWHDSETLWNRTIACTSDNYLAHNLLGNALTQRALAEATVDLGELDKAMAEYRAAIRIKSKYAEAHFNLGAALAAAGEYGAAMAEYRAAIRIAPDYAQAESNLGNVLALNGRLDEAMEHCRKAVDILPGFAPAHCNIGDIWMLRGRLEKAAGEFRRAVEIAPDYLYAQWRLGEALSAGGRPGEAVAAFRAAVELAVRQRQPALADALRARIAQCESKRQRRGQ